MQYDHAGKEIGDYYVDPTTRVFLEDFLRGFDSVALAISTIQNHKHDRAAEIAAMDYAVSLLEREDPNGVVNTEG